MTEPGSETAFDLLIVGAGLIGTSIGLAARHSGLRVALLDTDPARASLAARMGAGDVVAGPTPARLAVAAVPPAQVGRTCVQLLESLPATVVTHACSVQSAPAAEVEADAVQNVQRFVGGHPIAGREVSGPAAASADLFSDRPWAVCPLPGSASAATDAVVDLARICRAEPIVLTAGEHDELLARLSHVPQLFASALAATLAVMTEDETRLAGTGLRDTTRLADSDPAMWGQIAAANAGELATAVRAVAEPMLALAAQLESGEAVEIDEAVRALVTRGRAGRAMLPGKHGRRAVPLAVVRCIVPDAPGSLARLFADAALFAVNIEDVRVDHAPGQPIGFAELFVVPDDRDRLVRGLREREWTVTEGADEAL